MAGFGDPALPPFHLLSFSEGPLDLPLQTFPCPSHCLNSRLIGRIHSFIHSVNQLTHLLVVPGPAQGVGEPDQAEAFLCPGSPFPQETLPAEAESQAATLSLDFLSVGKD